MKTNRPISIWLSLILVSISWLFSLHLYTHPDYYWTFILIGLAIILSSLYFRKEQVEFKNTRYLFCTIPLFIASIILPFPYNLGVILLTLSLLLLPLPRFHPLFFSLLLIGQILIIQGLIVYPYMCWTAKFQQCDLLTPLIYPILKFLGLPVSLSQDTIFIETMRELYEFPTDWDKLALLPFLNILIGGVVILRFFAVSRKITTIGFFALTTALYLIIRYVLMLLIFLYLMYFVPDTEESSKVFIFWNPLITLMSFLPFLFLCSFFKLKANIIPAQFGSLFFDKNRIKGSILLGLAVFFIIGYFGFHDPGISKQGRVLIDEAHSDWEKTTKKYDTLWYGQDSGYNYYCIADYLSYYYKLERNFGKITPQLLANYDILILKIPTRPFSKEEISAIVKFVRCGGGLYLIGEHTNVFGSSAYLNAIAREFGFHFRYDCLFDIEKKFEQLYRPPKILPHPIVANMPCFLFATSCSIEPDHCFSRNIILSGGLKSLNIDYSSSNFYPQVNDLSKMDFGAFIQNMGVQYGQGRVVGFTDSTSFSNFSAFIPGKPELLLGTMNWLNKKNFLWWLNYLFLIAGLTLFIFGILSFRKKKVGGGLILMTTVLFMFAAGMLFWTLINKWNYPLPKPHTKPVEICFEARHSDLKLPIEGFVKNEQSSFEIFYQWVLRLGYFPVVGDIREKPKVVVIINPTKKWTSKDISQVKDYIASGGKVLLLDNPSNATSTSNSLLSAFGVEINHQQTINSTYLYAQPFNSYYPLGVSALSIKGGSPIFFSSTQEPIGVRVKGVKEGKGSLVVLSFSDRFANTGMGLVESNIPNEELWQVYQLEFEIFKGLVAGNL
ncbi:MAG: hypothetical protein QME42_04355 [bacterium]|nr:hypothetical protein [bacterium]